MTPTALPSNWRSWSPCRPRRSPGGCGDCARTGQSIERSRCCRELAEQRLRALVSLQLHDHAPAAGLADLKARLQALDEVQLCLEVSGSDDMVLLVACRDMAEFNAFADAELAASPVVRRYETSFVKKEVKNRPMIRLDERDTLSPVSRS